ATLVETDQPAERGQAPEKACQRRLFPHRIHVGDPVRDEHEVQRIIADHLIGNRSVTALRVPGFRSAHRRRVRPGPTGLEGRESRSTLSCRPTTWRFSGRRIFPVAHVGRALDRIDASLTFYPSNAHPAMANISSH